MAWCTRVDFAVSRNRDCLSKQVTARRLHWGFTEIHRVPCAVSVVSLLMIYRRHSQVGQPWLTVSFIESWQPFLFLLFFFFSFFHDLHLVSVARSEKSASWCIKLELVCIYQATAGSRRFLLSSNIRHVYDVFSRLRTIHQVNSFFRSFEIYRLYIIILTRYLAVNRMKYNTSFR